MKTKKDVINRFKELKGKTIQVVTDENYILGHFSPEFEPRIFYMTGSATQYRRIKHVGSTFVEFELEQEYPVGFQNHKEYAEAWFNRFLQRLRFTCDEEQKNLVIKKLSDSFYNQLKDNVQFHRFGFNDIIRCDLPKAEDIKIEGNIVTMYNNTFKLEEVTYD